MDLLRKKFQSGVKIVIFFRLRTQIILHERDNLKNLEWIGSIFFMLLDIGERIAGKQDWPSMIIEGPISPPPPRIAIFFFSHIDAHI